MSKQKSPSKDLIDLEKEAADVGLLLRIQVRRPFDLWTLRLVVAESINTKKIRLWGEMKAWAYRGLGGLQLDTMKVDSKAPQGVGDLVWAATMSWALINTPCRQARLLAICDDDRRHTLLVRYFQQKGFQTIREVGSSPIDLPLRMVWGGAGTLMKCDCNEVLERSCLRWEHLRQTY